MAVEFFRNSSRISKEIRFLLYELLKNSDKIFSKFSKNLDWRTCQTFSGIVIDFYENFKLFWGILTFSKNPLLVCTTSTKAASSFEIVLEPSLRSNHGLAGSKANKNKTKLFTGTISVEILATFCSVI